MLTHQKNSSSTFLTPSRSSSSPILTHTDGNDAAQAASEHNIPCATVTLTSVDSDITFTLNHPESGSNSNNLVTSVNNEPSDVALLLHTSGTTGPPKGILLSQTNLVSSVRNFISVYKLTDSDPTVIVLPLFHFHVAEFTVCRRIGDTPHWEVLRVNIDMNRSNATWYTADPTIHQSILNHHFSKPEPKYPCLRFIRSCDASLAPAVLNCLEKAFGALVLEAYAKAEATHFMCTNPLPEDGPRKPGSARKPMGWPEDKTMTILNENGMVQRPKCIGEVCIGVSYWRCWVLGGRGVFDLGRSEGSH